MNSILLSLVTVILSVALCSCNSETKWKSGEYEVYWIDVDLVLGLDLGDGNAIGRVMHKVIAVGDDDTWVVAERNSVGDTSVTTYYYWAKADDHRHKNADEIVLGPLTKSEFQKLKKELKLPEFAKRF